MGRVLTLTLKDLLLLRRDWFALFWVFGFPLVFGLFFGAIMGGMGGGGRGKMSVAIADEDRSDSSKALIDKLAKHESLRVQTSGPEGDPIGRDAASNGVRRGDLTAYLLIRKGFGESLLGFAADSKKLELGIDPSRQAEAGFLQGILMEANFSVLFQQFSNPDEMTRRLGEGRKQIEKAKDLTADQRKTLTEFLAMLDEFIPKLDRAKVKQEGGPFTAARLEVVPVTYDRARPRSSWEITFPSSISWAVLSVMMTFAMSIVIERKQGTLLRLRIAPLTKAHILAGKGLACFLACAAAALVLLLLGVLVLGVRVASWSYLLAAIGSASVCFAGLMMFLSVLGKSEQAVGGSASAIMMLMAMLGGGMIPLIAMPDWMLTVSHVSPVKWAIFGLEGAIWRGFGLEEMLRPCAILLAVGVVSFAVGVRVLSKRDF
jgi:ABC-2 type transport system permease protein